MELHAKIVTCKNRFYLKEAVYKHWKTDTGGNFTVEPYNYIVHCIRLIEVEARMLFNHRRLFFLLSVMKQHDLK